MTIKEQFKMLLRDVSPRGWIIFAAILSVPAIVMMNAPQQEAVSPPSAATETRSPPIDDPCSYAHRSPNITRETCERMAEVQARLKTEEMRARNPNWKGPYSTTPNR